MIFLQSKPKNTFKEFLLDSTVKIIRLFNMYSMGILADGNKYNLETHILDVKQQEIVLFKYAFIL